jgi:hypothetical protein
MSQMQVLDNDGPESYHILREEPIYFFQYNQGRQRNLQAFN